MVLDIANYGKSYHPLPALSNVVLADAGHVRVHSPNNV